MIERLNVERVLRTARHGAIGVQTATGVRLTPTAVAYTAGRLWFVAPTSSVKIRALRARPTVGVALRCGADRLSIRGTAELYDSWPPRPTLDPRVPLGLLAYFGHNAGVAAGIVTDVASGEAEVSPRTFVGVGLHATMLTRGTHVARVTGEWDSAQPMAHGRPPRLAAVAADLPERLAALLGTVTTADLAWLSPAGPVVIGCRVHDGEVLAPAAALAVIGDRGPAALTVHDSPGDRPSRYLGVMIRGALRCSTPLDGWQRVGVVAERVTWWDGYETGSLQA